MPTEQAVARPILSFDYLQWPGIRQGDAGTIRVLDDPHWAGLPQATVELDETFLLELGMGSGRDGLNLTVVPRSGRCVQVYHDDGGEPWRVVELQIDDAELRRLVQVLDENRFLQLAMDYDAVDIHDGNQWVIHLRTGGRDKYVFASNTFPPPLVNVARFVAERIVDARPELRQLSRLTRLGSLHAAHLWRDGRRYTAAAAPRSTGELDVHDSPRVVVLTSPDAPLPRGSRLQAVLVDRSAAGKIIAREISEHPSLYLRYDAKAIDPRHRYAIQVKLLDGGKVLDASEELAVITYGAPHALEVPLRRARPSE